MRAGLLNSGVQWQLRKAYKNAKETQLRQPTNETRFQNIGMIGSPEQSSLA